MSKGLSKVLKNKVEVPAAFDPNKTPQEERAPFKQFAAVWDTGATGSVITHRVVDECGLKPTGMTKVAGVGGVKKSHVYLVNIG